MNGLPEAVASRIGAVHDIAQNVTAPNAPDDDRLARWPEATMRALADAGLMGLTAPRSVGGLDGGMKGLVAVVEILARESASAGLPRSLHA